MDESLSSPAAAGDTRAGAAGPRIYNLFPLLCGTIAEWHDMLPRIADMGFDWIFLNPFHLTGASGSLYAVKDYYRYDPRLVPESEDGDTRLRDFAAACRDHGLSLMMDLVINHTAKDCVLADEHPEWYQRADDGSIISPGTVEANGNKVTWHDLGALAYDDPQVRNALIDYWCELVRHYADLGIRGFRCDAAYQVSADVWKPIVRAARKRRDDALFAAETLGCTPDQVAALEPAGFDFLFNSSKWWDFKERWLLEQYEKFRQFAPSIAFPESHDTERLAAAPESEGLSDPERVENAYRQRYLFAATFSTGVMMPVGYEYGFRKRLHVVETTPEDWEEKRFDLGDFVAAVHRMKASVPVLNVEGPQRRLSLHHHHHLTALLRQSEDSASWAIVVINRDLAKPHETRLDTADIDLKNGREITPGREDEELRPGKEIRLEPGEVRIFSGGG